MMFNPRDGAGRRGVFFGLKFDEAQRPPR